MFLASFTSSIFEYIQKNPQKAQRLVGLKYEQVQELLNLLVMRNWNYEQ